MELQGKRVAFLGDSITEGVGASEKQYTYVSQFALLSGAQVDNFGVSATRIARRRIPHEIPSWNDCFLDRAERITDDYDVIVVFGGTNDYAQANPNELGTAEDTDEHTFYGALKSLMAKLITAHPYATVVFATPIHRAKEFDYGLPNLCLRDYVNAVKEVAESYSIPVIDLWKTAGIQARVPAVMEEYLADGLHPNDRGHRRIAERMVAFLRAL